MIQKSELRLGLPVTFTKCYSIDPKRRISANNGVEAKHEQYCKVFKGVLVGQRNYIMSDWRREYGGMDEQDTIKGKQRPMLLVATSLYKMPVLVKAEDAEIDMEVSE